MLEYFITIHTFQDDTHYFVMTTKKHSLLDRKVLKKDLNDPLELLHPKNVNKEKLLEYIRDACDYCTDYQVGEVPAAAPVVKNSCLFIFYSISFSLSCRILSSPSTTTGSRTWRCSTSPRCSPQGSRPTSWRRTRSSSCSASWVTGCWSPSGPPAPALQGGS